MNNRLPLNGDVTAGDVTAGGAIASVAQRELDQLVDDDLAPAQRRRVLAALADQPDGWRRCALAFLEAQSWRRACRQLAAGPHAAELADADVPTTAPPQPAVLAASPFWRRQFWRPHEVKRIAASVAAVAAVLAAAFIVGLAMGRATSWSRSAPQIAAQETDGGAAIRNPLATSAQAAVNPPGGSPAKRERLVMHVLGFMNVNGEDGARHAVPVLAAPGLKIEPPPQQATTFNDIRRVGVPANLVMLDPAVVELINAIQAPPIR